MSDGITDAVREAIATFERWKENERKSFLLEFTTKELIAELCKRDDVTHYYETFTNFRHHIIVVKEE